MLFNLARSLEILERTPAVLLLMLQDLAAEWTSANEGPGTWSVYDIVGHLIEGEKTDWIPRMEIILSDQQDKTFIPFDRFAQVKANKNRSLAELLSEFAALRAKNLEIIHSRHLTGKDFERTGVHPDFGPVTLSQLLSTWTVHDLNHIAQISRVMAKQYAAAVGPWTAYLKILQQ
ncbi:DinB family protein [Segetibacter sp. 3557_3]|uniref:DinB family protein n=1 Tax=Segetibacter sp. 3557_3 TaxID=2547429 RepID=UPI00105915B8|nr:DinB family protein [Segetibacter sp. 3557_3]TDH28550.1 DinB family protein [Segetibacter sp. 3557_3]